MAIRVVQENREFREEERHRKSGVKKYQRRIDMSGSEAIDEIPYDLKDAVIGPVSLGSLNGVNSRALDDLQKISPERQGSSPENILRGVLESGATEPNAGGGGNFQEKALALYSRKRPWYLKK